MSKLQSTSFPVWRVRRGMDRRFRRGHPWVYSNELMESPKNVEPGAGVELQDAQGRFLAMGYGNPQSLIAFRALSRNSEQPRSRFFDDSGDGVHEMLVRAGKLRVALGLGQVSHRLCFGEADGLPGCVVDRYRVAQGQVFVVQAHTAGANRFTQQSEKWIRRYVESGLSDVNWDQTAIVLRNDLSVRSLEGLTVDEPQVLREVAGLNLREAQIHVASVVSRFGGVSGSSDACEKASLLFDVDLVQGQKTGFFLDQFSNIQLAAWRLKEVFRAYRRPVRILDLCSYVGQWSAQLSKVFHDMDLAVEVLAVDASQPALDRAKINVERVGVQCRTLKADVLRDLADMEPASFDLVIADPPALVKSRKNLPVGQHAYLQLMTQAMRLVKEGGAWVGCSCSSLLTEEIFSELLSKAAYRNQLRMAWVGRGGQSPDHPILQEFPEGRYLKAWVGIRMGDL